MDGVAVNVALTTHFALEKHTRISKLCNLINCDAAQGKGKSDEIVELCGHVQLEELLGTKNKGRRFCEPEKKWANATHNPIRFHKACAGSRDRMV